MTLDRDGHAVPRMNFAAVPMVARLEQADPPPPPITETTETVADRAARRGLAAQHRRAAWDRNLPPRYRDAHIDNLDSSQAPALLSRWWATGHQTLLLYSARPGTGKTYAAYAVGHQAVSQGAWVIGWTVVDLLDALRPDSLHPDPMSGATQCDLLILDDLGKEKDTDWTREQTHKIIDSRCRNGLRTIVTTNLADTAMVTRYSDSLVDRLVDDAVIVEITGASRRRPARWGDHT